MDGSDEIPNRSCISNIGESLNNNNNIELNNRKNQHWRRILIIAFLLLIFIVFILLMVYFIFRRSVPSSIPLMNSKRKNYATIVNSRMLENFFTKKNNN